jgi:glycyl-tRNA synthetase alpha chain
MRVARREWKRVNQNLEAQRSRPTPERKSAQRLERTKHGHLPPPPTKLDACDAKGHTRDRHRDDGSNWSRCLTRKPTCLRGSRPFGYILKATMSSHNDPKALLSGADPHAAAVLGRPGLRILQPYDMEMGAGTFHPATTLRALGPEPVEGRLCAALAPSQRWPLWREPQPPAALLPVSGDPEAFPARPAGPLPALAGRHWLGSATHDIRFVEDDWESPTLGAWGLGWECWCDGMEVSQFTYFQQVCGQECAPVSGELTYGLERIAMYVQGVENVYDLNFNGREGADKVTYGDVFLQAEEEYSRHNFEAADTAALFRHFEDAEAECRKPPGSWRARRRGRQHHRAAGL